MTTSDGDKPRHGGPRPGAGPKPKKLREKQRHRVIVLLSDAELRQIEQAAAGKPLSAYLRERGLG